MNTQPPPHPHPTPEGGPPKQAVGEGLQESCSSQLVHLHTRAHTCTHMHTHARAHMHICTCMQLRLWTHCAHAQVSAPVHTDIPPQQPVPGTRLPSKRPARAQKHSRRQVPHSSLTLLTSQVAQSFAELVTRFTSTTALGAGALISQMRKLGLREGTCPGLHSTRSMVQRGGCRPKRSEEEKWGWRTGECWGPEATGMPPDPDPDHRVLADLAESRAGWAAHG